MCDIFKGFIKYLQKVLSHQLRKVLRKYDVINYHLYVLLWILVYDEEVRTKYISFSLFH